MAYAVARQRCTPGFDHRCAVAALDWISTRQLTNAMRFEVGRHEYHQDAWCGARSTNIQLFNHTVCKRRPKHVPVGLSVQVEVVGNHALATQQTWVFSSVDRLTHGETLKIICQAHALNLIRCCDATIMPRRLAPRHGADRNMAPGQFCACTRSRRSVRVVASAAVLRNYAMKFGVFYEHQLPRPWGERSEYDLLQNSLTQIELADQLGYDYAWEVEHHFLEEYSHSTAPEVFLGAASQRTRNIRLGHGVIQITTNQPHRVAEKVATLDLLSGGRVELGMGEGAGPAELHPFGVQVRSKRDRWEEAVRAIVPMFTHLASDEPARTAANRTDRLSGGLMGVEPCSWCVCRARWCASMRAST